MAKQDVMVLWMPYESSSTVNEAKVIHSVQLESPKPLGKGQLSEILNRWRYLNMTEWQKLHGGGRISIVVKYDTMFI
jgi:hypothetical protein